LTYTKANFEDMEVLFLHRGIEQVEDLQMMVDLSPMNLN
jgi:hypothetical protein